MSTPERNSDSAVATLSQPRSEDETVDSKGPCILFATNGSAEAEAALRFASSLANQEGMLLRVLTILQPLPALPVQAFGAAWPVTIETERGERILDRVRDTLSSMQMAPAAQTSMLVGSPGATIARAAHDWNATYIIVGAGRHGVVDRLLAGDTVVRLMRHADVPVIAVPASQNSFPRNGVVGIDFGAASLIAARAAAAVIGDGELHLVHVRPEIDLPATDPDAWEGIYESGAESLLTKLATELKRSHPAIRVDTSLTRGHAPAKVLDLAERVKADFIAVGQHGHGVVDRFLFGSVAQAMVRSATCAVLVAPSVKS